jgi:hypothetical protein
LSVIAGPADTPNIFGINTADANPNKITINTAIAIPMAFAGPAISLPKMPAGEDISSSTASFTSMAGMCKKYILLLLASTAALLVQ